MGLQSPSSSEVKRSRRRFLSEAAVHLMRSSLSVEYASSSGGWRMMSQTSVMNSLARATTTWSKRVLWLVMFQVENCASTCANQTRGSAGQKEGCLTATATEAGPAQAREVALSGAGWAVGQTSRRDVGKSGSPNMKESVVDSHLDRSHRLYYYQLRTHIYTCVQIGTTEQKLLLQARDVCVSMLNGKEVKYRKL